LPAKRPTPAELFGRHLRELRLARGLTQKEVEERSGVLVPYLSSLEAGARLPTLTMAMRLAAALGCKVSELTKPLDGYEE
jgi:transcriptional regulator with XRE-family HTH domain